MAAELERRDGTITSADGTRLFWQSWEVPAPKATFAVIHGLGEHGGRYDRFAIAMAERGFTSFAVDLRGMGRSEGARGHVLSWSEWIKDAETFVQMVADHPSAGEVIPLGHSFGGVVVLSSVLEGAVVPRRFVVSNPALKLRMRVPGWKLAFGRAAGRLLPTIALANGVNPDSLSRDPAVAAAYRNDALVHDRITARLFNEWQATTATVLARAPEFRTPFLILVGEDDPIVDPAGSRELDAAATGAPHELHAFAGRYHEPFNDLDADAVFDDLAAWAGAPVAAAGP